MATIGKSRAVLEVGKLRMRGFLAWMAWLLVHVFLLIGFRNRVVVMFEWAVNYLTSHRGARLIPKAQGKRHRDQAVHEAISAASDKAQDSNDALKPKAQWSDNAGAKPVV
jgi:hypothetical protein